MQRGLTRLTALTYMQQVKSLFARWCTPYYKDAGFDIPPLEYPRVKAKAQRYVRPPAELLQKVKSWYRGLTGEKWFAATMMLEFGMRNGDVLRLRKENFVTKGDDHFLHYVPHKTELSSARRVYWPIHSSIWEKFMEYGGLDGLDVVEETFHEINRDLRALGFTGSKGGVRAEEDLHRPHIPEVRRRDGDFDIGRQHPHCLDVLRRPIAAEHQGRKGNGPAVDFY